MKTSTFLTKVLKKFGNGKNFTKDPYYSGPCECGAIDCDYNASRTRASRGKNNLTGMISRVAKETGYTKRYAIGSIVTSLGHTNVTGFESSDDTTFGAVKAVVKAAIKRERANGN